METPFTNFVKVRLRQIEPCPGRKHGPCRPKSWSPDDLGFLEVMVMQCAFCGKQVIYQQSSNKEIVENASNHVSVGASSRGVFLH